MNDDILRFRKLHGYKGPRTSSARKGKIGNGRGCSCVCREGLQTGSIQPNFQHRGHCDWPSILSMIFVRGFIPPPRKQVAHGRNPFSRSVSGKQVESFPEIGKRFDRILFFGCHASGKPQPGTAKLGDGGSQQLSLVEP